MDLIRPKGKNLSLQSDELLHWEAEVKVPNSRSDMALVGRGAQASESLSSWFSPGTVSRLLIGLGHVALCLSYLTHGWFCGNWRLRLLLSCFSAILSRYFHLLVQDGCSRSSHYTCIPDRIRKLLSISQIQSCICFGG